ncbi:MAG: VWA domain-containing protein [Cytophagaceae bacterium]|nr:VWA domain-containing protein [Gemmatimonadaceae bacterium]
MSRRRIFAIVFALVAIFASRFVRDRGDDPPGDTATATAPADNPGYKATVQEGLGASVAILLDNSGSMKDKTESGSRQAKATIARDVLEQVLSQTEAFVVRQPGFPVNVGLYTFNSDVEKVLPIGPYDRATLKRALESLPAPKGGTAIGEAMDVAAVDLYSAGTIRKYILVVTDGENTSGADPAEVAAKIERMSEGAVRLLLVAFDVDRKRFDFVSAVNGVLVAARDGIALRASLDTLYRGKILAEAIDAGETQPDTIPRK